MPKQKELCLDWTPHKAEIKDHYVVQDLSLEELMRYMEATYAFRATKAQYETQLNKWDFRKNMTKKEWDYALRRMRKRKLDGKESDVYFNGSKVPEKKIKKQMSRHYSLSQEQLLDTTPIPNTPEAIIVATPQATVECAASLPNHPQSGLPEFIGPRADLNMEHSPDNLLARQDHLPLPPLSPYREDTNIFNQGTLYSQPGADMQTFWETNSVSTATVNIISNLPYFQFQALLESRGQFQINPAQTRLVGIPRRKVSEFQTIDIPPFTIGDIHEKDALALLQISNKEGQTLLAELFGPSIKADGHELLSQFRSQVSSLERHDGELAKKFQPLFALSDKQLLLQILHMALYRLSNNLLSEDATDKFVQWLIKQQQNELLVSFLQFRMPSVHACATKILEKIDLSPLKGVCGGRHLVHAVSQSNVPIVQILLKNGADVDTPGSNRYQFTALQYATFRDQPQMIQILLKAGANIDAIIAHATYSTALSLAVGENMVELVRILVTAGANFDICTVGDLSAINYSAFYCDDELHQRLLSGSGKTHISITSHRTWNAAKEGIQALSSYLAERDEEDSDLKREVMEYALQHAIRNEDPHAIRSLLRIGVAPNSEIQFKREAVTPLSTAVKFCDIDTVKILLEAGGNVYHPSVLSQAIYSQKTIEMLQFLLDVGANIEISGGEPLRIAVDCENIEAVQFLLLHGANVNDPEIGASTALQLAIGSRNIELLNILLDAGADVDASCVWGDQTALGAAVRRIDRSGLRLEIARILLAAGADVNGPQSGRQGASILQSAICMGDENIVKTLLKEGADVNSLPKGKKGRSPIQAAAERGSIPLVKLLLESGADVNASAGRDNGRTAIQAASSAANPTMDLIDFLIDSGADIHAPAGLNGGATALQGAATRGHIKIALKFLEAGADVNAAEAILYGQTALDGAAEHGRLDMVQMLLNAGACGDSTKAHRFDKAVKLARTNGHFAVAKLLEQA